MSQVQFFKVYQPQLKLFVRHYWTLKTLGGSSPSLLLPMDHADLILAPEGTFQYYLEDRVLSPRGIHFHGIRRKSIAVLARGGIQVWGVSFQPWGFQPVAGNDMKGFVDQIVNLRDFNPELSQDLEAFPGTLDGLPGSLDGLPGSLDAGEALIVELERVLVKAFEAARLDSRAMERIRQFIEADPEDIGSYCDIAGISIRHMQRLFNQYVGISPRNYQRLKQFETSSRELLYGKQSTSLTNISVDSGYYDQSHFIRSFRDYTAYAPQRFREECPALKSELFNIK
jgi:AraC-like DNA-binding protein